MATLNVDIADSVAANKSPDEDEVKKETDTNIPMRGKLAARLAKMTEAEKDVYTQQKAAAEKEMKHKKRDMISNFLQDKLQVEQRNTDFNRAKIDTYWRQIMRQLKSVELKKEVQASKQAFGRTLERKDEMIKLLMAEISNSENQHQMAVEEYQRRVADIIDKHQLQCDVVKKAFDAEFNILADIYCQELESLIADHASQYERLLDILYSMEKQFKEQDKDSKDKHHTKLEEIRDDHLEEKHAMRMQLESNIRRLWRRMKNAHKYYVSNTQYRKIKTNDLKTRDIKRNKEYKERERKIQELNNRIQKLKSDMFHLDISAGGNNEILRQEKHGLVSKYVRLKQQVKRMQMVNRKKLGQLTMVSANAVTTLQKHNQQVEDILKTAQLCSRLEMEKEKILPFYKESQTIDDKLLEEAEQSMNAEDNKIAELTKELDREKFSDMRIFWKKYNSVLLDIWAKRKDHDKLKRENSYLREIMKQYIDGTMVNDEIMKKENPLLIVNNRTNIKLPAIPIVDKRIRRQIKPVVEAQHVMRHNVYTNILA